MKTYGQDPPVKTHRGWREHRADKCAYEFACQVCALIDVEYVDDEGQTHKGVVQGPIKYAKPGAVKIQRVNPDRHIAGTKTKGDKQWGERMAAHRAVMAAKKAKRDASKARARAVKKQLAIDIAHGRSDPVYAGL